MRHIVAIQIFWANTRISEAGTGTALPVSVTYPIIARLRMVLLHPEAQLRVANARFVMTNSWFHVELKYSTIT
jgi:hypothetical protein